MRPLVSVIVPNYNHERFLTDRLDCIYNQTVQDFEVILLDDCSSDGSISILKRYASHKKTTHYLVNNLSPKGTFIQWEKGIELAQGSFIWIAESDDSCQPEFLENLIVPLLNDDSIGLSFCQSKRMNADGEITGNWLTHTQDYNNNIFVDDFILNGTYFIERYLIHKNVIPNVSAVLFRSKSLKEILPLIQKPFFRYNADWFYYIQILIHYKVAFISLSLNNFRYHDNSVISRLVGESGVFRLLEMELQGRKYIRKYIKSTVSDWSKIHLQSKKADKKILLSTTKRQFDQGNYFKLALFFLGRPPAMIVALKQVLKKFLKSKYDTRTDL